MPKKTSRTIIQEQRADGRGFETYVLNRSARKWAARVGANVHDIKSGPLKRGPADPVTGKWATYTRDGEVFEPRYTPRKVKPNKYPNPGTRTKAA